MNAHSDDESDRLRLEQEFKAHRMEWEAEHKLDETADMNDIADVIHQWTEFPQSVDGSEADKLVHMEERLHERIIGQDEAIKVISDAIRRARSGLKDPRRPSGSFIFNGSFWCG